MQCFALPYRNATKYCFYLFLFIYTCGIHNFHCWGMNWKLMKIKRWKNRPNVHCFHLTFCKEGIKGVGDPPSSQYCRAQKDIGMYRKQQFFLTNLIFQQQQNNINNSKQEGKSEGIAQHVRHLPDRRYFCLPPSLDHTHSSRQPFSFNSL